MCGISLSAKFLQDESPRTQDSPSADLGWIERSIQLQRHRGPDSSSVETLESGQFRVAVGHCRLSIIDLNERSKQPMWSQDGNLCLSYNGELFNYLELRSQLARDGSVFHTESDTEVVLKAWEKWGSGCLERFDGMFAFVVIDREHKKIFGARDAFGVKPMHWKYSDAGLFISSEIWPLVDTDSKPNLQTVVDYVSLGYYDVADATFVEGVNRLEAGHAFEFDLATQAPPLIWDWWSPDFSQAQAIEEDQAERNVRAAVLLSIQRQMISDVPIGFALSGGLDSSVLVCGARSVAPEAKIVTVTYSPGAESSLDESHWAKVVSEFVAAEAKIVEFDSSVLRTELRKMVRQQGEPFSSTRIFAQYKVFEAFSKEGITVAIEGQGGDELFAGYDGFPHFRLLSLIEEGRLIEAARFVRKWSKLPNHRLSRLLLQFLSLVIPERLLPKRFIYSLKAKVLGEDNGQVIDWAWCKSHGVFLGSRWSPKLSKDYRGRRLVEALLTALRNTYIPQLVRQGDRNSMAWSVENRVPFLSVPLVETVLSLPEDFFVGDDALPKSLLRKSMRGIVPDSVLDRKDKVGFATSQGDLVNLEHLASESVIARLQEIGIFDSRFLNRLSVGTLGVTESNYMLWRVLNLGIWLDVFASFKHESQNTESLSSGGLNFES